jgi:hypothetical protein
MSVQIHNFPFDNPFPEILQNVFSHFYNYSGSLDDLHELLTTELLSNEEKEYHKQLHGWRKDRDSVFVRKFHEYVDKHTSFNEAYYKFLRTTILPLFPNETKIAIQKTPNIRFSVPDNAAIGVDPNDPENIIGLHCDRDFGHHPSEQNFIVPITKMFETNSLYYEPSIDSGIDPLNFESLSLNTNEFVHAYFNKLRHCNRINKTNKTRISFDIRIIPYSEYEKNIEDFKGTKFELGKYYIVL